VHEWRNWKVFWVPDKKSIFSSEEDAYDENDMDAPMLDPEQEEEKVTETDAMQAKLKE
jgi:hypothetical protein